MFGFATLLLLATASLASAATKDDLLDQANKPYGRQSTFDFQGDLDVLASACPDYTKYARSKQ